jgi:hypothetical protein
MCATNRAMNSTASNACRPAVGPSVFRFHLPEAVAGEILP